MIARNESVGPGIDRTWTGHKVRLLVQVGQTFGRLRVIVPDRRLHRKRAAVVRCACGSPDKRVRHEHLLSGGVRSCGCLRAELRDMWRLREDDDVAAPRRTDERLPESDLLRVTLDRLPCP